MLMTPYDECLLHEKEIDFRSKVDDIRNIITTLIDTIDEGIELATEGQMYADDFHEEFAPDYYEWIVEFEELKNIIHEKGLDK